MRLALFTLAVMGISAWRVAIPGAADTGSINVGHFSTASPGSRTPAGWQPLTFKNISRQTRYDLLRDGDATVVRASSDASASGLVRKIDIDPGTYPRVSWREGQQCDRQQRRHQQTG